MAQPYTVKKEINGTVYTAQFNGLSAAMKTIDNSYIDGTNNTSTEKLSKALLSDYIVDPKISIDDFDSMEELNEVIAFAREVMQGNFREKKDESAIKAASKK